MFHTFSVRFFRVIHSSTRWTSIYSVFANRKLHFVPMAAASSRKRSADVIDWLRPEEVREKKLRLPKTCEWIAREAAFQNWTSPEGQSPILWIHGPPGCGKTFLAQYIVDEIGQTAGSHATISYFCDEYSSPDSIMRSVLAQLVDNPKFEPAVLLKIKEELEGLLEITPGAVGMTYKLWDKLSAILQMAPAFSLIIDGLDEVPSKSLIGPDFKLLTSLIEMVTSSTQNIRFLVTSRTEQDLRSTLHGFPDILLTAQKVQDDMERYVRTEIDRYEHLKPHSKEIVPALVEQSDGIFIWAGLSVKTLGLESTGEAVLAKLQDISTSLDDIYAQILEQTTKIEIQVRLRKHILRWVTAAIRPIRLIELANAVAVEDNMFIPDIEDKAIAACSSLVKAENGILKPLHFSLKGFLRSDWMGTDSVPYWRPEEEANHTIARTCLTYLLHDVFSSPVGEKGDEEALLVAYPFLEYSTLYWVHHVFAAEEASLELQALILKFFNSNNAAVWFQSLLPIVLSRSVLPIPPRPAYSIRFAYLFLVLKPKLANYFAPSQKLDFEQTFSNFIASSHEHNLEQARTSFGLDSIRALESTVDLAEVYSWLPDKGDKAQALLEEALKTVSSRDDEASKVLTMTCYQALADGYKRNGRYQDAKTALQNLLEIGDKELQPNDPTIMFALDSLGWVCMRLGELDASAQHLRRALDIASAHYGSQSPMTLRSKVTLAEVLGKLGLASEAEVLCSELKNQVRARRENGNPLPRDSISQLNTLAAVLMQQKKFGEAVETYEVVVRDREKAFGAKHRITLWATLQLAVAKESAGELAQALELLEDLLPMQEEVLGDHPDTQETRRRIDELKAKLA